MNKLQTILVLFLITIFAVPVFAQSRERRENRAQRHEQRRERRVEHPRQYVQPRVTRQTPSHPQYRTEQRSRYYQRRPRIVIFPSLVLRFPFFHRGYRVQSYYDLGFRDGFFRGNEDFKYGYPCDPDFVFDRTRLNSQYEQGFSAGYRQGCRF